MAAKAMYLWVAAVGIAAGLVAGVAAVPAIVAAAGSTLPVAPAFAIEWRPLLLAAAYGDLYGVGVLVLGAAYRGGVKETAFSGVFPTVEALKARGAVPFVSDPMYTSEELAAHDLLQRLDRISG